MSAAIFGAALYGDGIITPAISVLSAVEGLEVATEAARPLVIPLTCLILIALFSGAEQRNCKNWRHLWPHYGHLVCLHRLSALWKS